MSSRSGRPRLRISRVGLLFALAVAVLLPTFPGFERTTAGSAPTPARGAPVPSAVGSCARSTVSLPSLTGVWENLTPNLTTYPPPRAAAAMADDPLLHAVVLFGGNDPFSGNALGDTWEFVNGSWTDLTSSLTTAPSSRWGAGLAWDPEYQGLILFGGRDNAYTNWIYNDTWLFNSTGWHQLNVTGDVAPSPRTPYGGLIYDATDSYLLLFGGNYDNSYRLNDTWSFTNDTWMDRTSNLSVSPPQAGFSSANDSPDGYDLFYGGATWSGGNYGETWTYGNGAWTNRTGSSGPQPPMTTGSDAMTYDPFDSGVVLFSGQDNSYGDLNDTYLYSGGNWTNITAGVGAPPLGRWEAKMAYDASLGGDLMFGGNEGTGLSYSILAQKDTWEFAHPFRAAAAANVTKGIIPLAVNFTSIAGPTTGAVTYTWSFGDGTPNATSENTTHTFAKTGTFSVTVIARDTAARVATTTLAVHVYPPLSVSAAVVGSAIDLPLSVAFHSNVIGGVPPLHVHWSFGDGASSTAGNASHAYSATGTYGWSLVATDSDNHTRSIFGNVTVYPTLIVSDSSNTTHGVVPLNVSFTASVSAGDPPYALNWSFGDGGTAGNLSSVDHTYVTAGLYTATLTVTDGGGGSFQTYIVVNVVDPLALVTSVSPLSGPAPLNVQYLVTPTGGEAPYSISWTFDPAIGDSASAQGSFTFGTSGRFWVNLSVTDAYGDRSTQSIPVVVTEPLASALTVSAKQGLAPFDVTFNDFTTGGVAPFSYVWTFGDGGGLTGGATVSHLYTGPGTFLAQAQADSADGQHAKATFTVEVGALPQLKVSSNLSTIPFGEAVAFTAQVSGGFPAWSFDWTGLPTGCAPANSSTIDCAPTTPGSYHVGLTATDTIGDARTGQVNVTVLPAPAAPPASGLSTLDLLLVGAVVVAAVAVVGVLVVRRRRPRPLPEESGTSEYDAPAEPTPSDGVE